VDVPTVIMGGLGSHFVQVKKVPEPALIFVAGRSDRSRFDARIVIRARRAPPWRRPCSSRP